MYEKNKGKKCKAGNCDDEAVCKGCCWKHYQQERLRGKLIEKDYVYISGFCKIIGCKGKIFAKGFCQKHYLEERKDEKKINS